MPEELGIESVESPASPNTMLSEKIDATKEANQAGTMLLASVPTAPMMSMANFMTSGTPNIKM